MRKNAIEIEKEEFKKIGYELIDTIAHFIGSIDELPVTRGMSPLDMQSKLGNASLPLKGRPAAELIQEASQLLMNYSLLNGHPKYMGYITSSPAPIGMLADLLAAAVNPNCGGHFLSPMATEIERQTIKWLTEFIGVPSGYGGILVSGGNMANFTAFLAARTAKAPGRVKKEGIGSSRKMITYCPKTTHTWIEKAVSQFGNGSDSIRWIPTDSRNKMDNELLKEAIEKDLDAGFQPFMVIGTAGDVSTGAVDDLQAIAEICKMHDLWFHIDGAYGMPAAVLPGLKAMFAGVEEADSIALDPHKWLYSPLEAGCTMVKNPKHLTDTFSFHPEYYHFSEDTKETALNYYEYGLQNSRGFRALKVWLAMQQIGRDGYQKLIGEDIALSKLLFELARQHKELQAVTQNLSITTFRYIPDGLSRYEEDNMDYLNRLNEKLLDALQKGGEVFLSNAVVQGRYCLRGCIVNFRTSEKDINEIIEIVVREGRKIHQILREE